MKEEKDNQKSNFDKLVEYAEQVYQDDSNKNKEAKGEPLDNMQKSDVKLSGETYPPPPITRDVFDEILGSLEETLKADLEGAIEQQEQELREEFNAGREEALKYALEMLKKHQELSLKHNENMKKRYQDVYDWFTKNRHGIVRALRRATENNDAGIAAVYENIITEMP